MLSAVHLRPWRNDDAAAVAVVIDDPHLVRWSSMSKLGVDLWIAEQQAGIRGLSLVICQSDDDRPLGKIALRMPEHASPATTCAGIHRADHPVGELSCCPRPEDAASPAPPSRRWLFALVRPPICDRWPWILRSTTSRRFASPSAWVPNGATRPEPNSTAPASREPWSSSYSRSPELKF